MLPIEMIRSHARRLIVVQCRDLPDVRQVFSIQRVGSPEYLRLAMSVLAMVTGGQADADELRSRLLGARTPEDEARIRGEMEEVANRQATARIQDPEAVGAVVDGTNRLVMAAVNGIGFARDDIEVPTSGDGKPLLSWLLPEGTQPMDVCRPLTQSADAREPVYMQPIRWASPTEMSADRLRISELNEKERGDIARLIVEAFISTKDVATFRGRAAPAGDREPVGSAVRPAAGGSAPVRRPAKGRARPGSDGGG